MSLNTNRLADKGDTAMKLQPVDEDYQNALHRICFADWMVVKKLAIQICADRQIKEISDRVSNLISESRNLTGQNDMPSRQKWLKIQDEIDLLWKKQDALMHIAYPESYTQCVKDSFPTEVSR